MREPPESGHLHLLESPIFGHDVVVTRSPGNPIQGPSTHTLGARFHQVCPCRAGCDGKTPELREGAFLWWPTGRGPCRSSCPHWPKEPERPTGGSPDRRECHGQAGPVDRAR